MVKIILKELGFNGNGEGPNETISESELVMRLGSKLHLIAYDFFTGSDNKVFYLFLDDECNSIISIGIDYDTDQVFEAVYREVSLL